MTTREHLIYHLQELYAFHRDFLPLLDSMRHESGNERLRDLLHDMHEGLKSEMEILERALNLLGGQYKHERNAVVPGLKEDTQRFKHQMNPSQEQLDIHSALEALKVAHFAIGAYFGDMELARSLGEQDVVTLLQENLQRQRNGEKSIQQYMPALVQGITRAETRHAA